ncbi:MAG: M48 family metallopeptidase [Bacteroidales bacterium]|nr:M48 family metallopeptidase [Bacteroidales bacterium]MCF8345124.1 M48 family metallopeptidase [Bacteroidales bacterium]MCF8352141.1 M48 family metallopeptidase [Bacteroidales bacterium]MCF8375766.1 M48 family metallopeptidase [Bacteroidales bacterium]
MAEMLFYFIVAIIVFNFILELVLDYLNQKNWSDQLPAELKGFYNEDKYKKSQQYFRAKQRFSILTGSLSFIAMIVMLILGGFAWLDDFVRQYTSNPILMALLFFGILAFAADLLSTPFSAWYTFVVEERFGFNKTSVKTFVLDKLKGWLLGAIIGGGLLALIIWIWQSTGQWFWLVAWGAISLFMILMFMFYSNLIVPLFNKQRPLKEGELRNMIEKLAGQLDFGLKNIYVMDGSKRSTKANAYFTGMGPKKRIVLFDTLINNHTNEEIVAVLAHEIGHFKKKHTTLALILSMIQTGVMLYILSVFIDQPVLSKALGAEQSSFHMGVLAFGLLYSPLSLILGLISNYISRKNEYAADRFAGKNYRADKLRLALKKLSVDNLSNLQPHPCYVFFYYSHPPLLKRLAALRRLKKS